MVTECNACAGLKVSSLVQHHALASELLYKDVLIFSTRRDATRPQRERLTRLRMCEPLNVTPNEVEVAELQGWSRAPLAASAARRERSTAVAQGCRHCIDGQLNTFA